jgi:hypothetical protein
MVSTEKWTLWPTAIFALGLHPVLISNANKKGREIFDMTPLNVRVFMSLEVCFIFIFINTLILPECCKSKASNFEGARGSIPGKK